jgi:hypothetical protein
MAASEVFTLSGPVSQMTEESTEALFSSTALVAREPISIPATII